MEQDRAERLALPCGDRDRDERLEALLLELGHVLEARILECPSRMNAGSRCSSVHQASPWPRSSDDLADQMIEGLRRGPKDEPLLVAIDQIDETGVYGARIGEEPHNAPEHLFQVSDEPIVEMIW